MVKTHKSVGRKVPSTVAPKTNGRAAAAKNVVEQPATPARAPRGAKMKALQQAVWLSVGGKTRKRAAEEVLDGGASEEAGSRKKLKSVSAEKPSKKRFLPPAMDEESEEDMEVDLPDIEEDGSLSNKENIPVYRRPFHNIPVASQVDRTNYDLNLNSSDYDLPPLAKDTDEEPEEDSDDDDEAGDTNDFEIPTWVSKSGSRAMVKMPASTQNSAKPHVSNGKLVVPTAPKARKSSKATLAAAVYEQPVWNGLVNPDEGVKPTVKPAEELQDPDDCDSDIELVDPRHGSWPLETHLIYPAPGAKMALGPQNIQVQRVARAAIQGLMLSMYFEDAFPDVRLRTKFNRDALYTAASELNYEVLARRIQSDVDYVDALAGLTNPRMGLARLDIKKTAAASVPGYFGFSAKTTADEVNALIIDDTYIYPRQGNKIENNRPYRHAILVAIMKDQVFTGVNSLGVRHRSRFTSSLQDTPDLEPEIPASLLSLAATATYAAIAEFLSGETSKTDFSASLYTDAYHRHMKTLGDIKSHNPRAYHVLMASLFNECCGINIASGSRSGIQGIDFEGMAVTMDGS